MDYTPPLRDMRFVLDDVLDLSELAKTPDFSHADIDTTMALLEESGRWNREVVAPLNTVGDVEGSRLDDSGSITTPTGFADAYRQYVEAAWGSIQFDPDYGGGGMPWLVGVANQELTVAACMAFSLCPMLTQGAIEALTSHGTESQKVRYLEKMITGEWSGTMNLTEPQAGSDVGALTTKAVPNDDGTWSITGNKIFITWGEHDMAENIVHLVLARTPGAPPGTKGISLFLVPKYHVDEAGNLGDRNDVRLVSIEHKLGIHGSPTCVLAFGENGGAIGEMVGEENRGMSYMFTMMNNARLTVGLEGLAVSERAYQQARRFAEERLQGRAVGAEPGVQSPIIEHPDVRRMLLTMKASIEAMRGLIYLNAMSIDWARAASTEAERRHHQERVELLTPLSKAWCTDIGMELVSTAVQVFGGMGYVEETGIAQHFRDLRIAPIYEGTNGIQAIDLVGRKLPMRDGAVVAAFLDEVDVTAARMAGVAGLEASGAALATATASVREATEWLLAAEHPNDRLAGATPYLRMLGTLAGGWMSGRAALAAVRRIDAGDDVAYHQARRDVAVFFLTQLLPAVTGLVPAVTAGSDPLYAVPVAAL